MTVLDLIYGSLRLNGVLAQGQVPSNSEVQDALLALNGMIDSFSTENLMIPNIKREVFTCVAGQATYTMGSGGDFNSTRPTKITNAGTIVFGSNPVLELPVSVINEQQYASIFIKSIQSTIPLWLYSDNAYPNTNINLWPVPQVNSQMAIYSLKTLTSYTSLTTTIVLPPGGTRMLRFNLAVELAPEYGKNELDPKIIEIANNSKMDFKRSTNMNRPQLMATDDLLVGPKGSFNWLTGDTV